MAIKNLPNFDDIPNSENLDANDSNEDSFEFLSKLSTDEFNNLLEEAKDLLTQVAKGDSSKYKDFSNKLDAILEDACEKIMKMIIPVRYLPTMIFLDLME